jgi:hypothetical protein
MTIFVSPADNEKLDDVVWYPGLIAVAVGVPAVTFRSVIDPALLVIPI